MEPKLGGEGVDFREAGLKRRHSERSCKGLKGRLDVLGGAGWRWFSSEQRLG